MIDEDESDDEKIDEKCVAVKRDPKQSGNNGISYF